MFGEVSKKKKMTHNAHVKCIACLILRWGSLKIMVLAKATTTGSRQNHGFTVSQHKTKHARSLFGSANCRILGLEKMP